MAFVREQIADALTRAGWSDVNVQTSDYLLPGMPRFIEGPVLALERAWQGRTARRYLGQSHFITARAA